MVVGYCVAHDTQMIILLPFTSYKCLAEVDTDSCLDDCVSLVAVHIALEDVTKHNQLEMIHWNQGTAIKP